MASAAAGAYLTTAAPGLRIARAAEGSGENGDILVVLFLRGGQDSLQLVAPADDADYNDYRPNIAVSSSDGHHVGALDGVDFFLHPSVPELNSLYSAGDLAIVQATGLPAGGRSHFENQDYMERGDDGDNQKTRHKTGWITRHIDSIGETRPVLSSVALGSSNPLSLLGHPQVIALSDSGRGFDVDGPSANADLFAAINSGDSEYQQLAQQTVEAINTVQSGLVVRDQADISETGYTSGPLSESLRSLAQLIKMDVGVDIATVEQGNWDHHENILDEFPSQAEELSRSLNAFWTDMVDYRDRITLVTMTEFGRRVDENSNAGTDHGAASSMLVLSKSANGGKLHGDWPGLSELEQQDGALRVTTDYRQVLSEVLVKRKFNSKVDQVFPDISYAPIGVL